MRHHRRTYYQITDETKLSTQCYAIGGQDAPRVTSNLIKLRVGRCLTVPLHRRLCCYKVSRIFTTHIVIQTLIQHFTHNLTQMYSRWHGWGTILLVERRGAVVKRRTRDREVPGSIPTSSKCCFLEQETLSTLLSTGFYPGKKEGHMED